MAVGFSDGTSYRDSTEWLATVDTRSDKQRSGQSEINLNSQSGDFQSRFGASDASTMPLGASTELAGALKQSAGTGTPGNDYNTKLSAEEETQFTDWKSRNAPNDSGADYDLRGAFRAGLGRSNPDEHLPDTFKKPNHPTFSDQSQYAKYAPDKAGTWDGDRYIPPVQRSTLAEDIFGKGENDIRPALTKLYEHTKELFKLPGDVYAGKIDPMSKEGIEKAFQLSTLLVTGPMPVAAKFADGTLGSFAGVKSTAVGTKNLVESKSLKGRLYEAQEMESVDAAHSDEIWEKTGWFRGADNRWRYEIDDSKATLKESAFEHTITPGINGLGVKGAKDLHTVSLKAAPTPEFKSNSFEDLSEWMNARKEQAKGPSLHLPDVLDHPELYAAYPDLKAVRVEPLPKAIQEDTKAMGHMSSDGPSGTLRLRDDLNPEYAKSVILHEVQHQIQKIEGFAPGGGKEQFLPEKLSQAEKLLEDAKKEILPQVKEKGFSNHEIARIKWLSTLDSAGQGIVVKNHPELNGLVERAKEQGVFKQLQNIARSEKHLKDANDEAFEKYQRIMGEVEARNVQARMNYDKFQRAYIPPVRTEEVPRIGQIDITRK